MLIGDNSEFVCVACRGDLAWRSTVETDGDDVLTGTLACTVCEKHYPVRNGIARFVDDLEGYNSSWNYKWTAIDQGRGLNYRIIDQSDPAYAVHDLFDRNSHGGSAFARMRGGRAVDIGCGVGQYSIRSLKEHQPRKIVALDLTESVDIFRSIVRNRYPEFLDRIVFAQASVFAMPLREESFDLVYSLGVLHHTGRTLDALRAACQLVRPGGDLNVWVYASSCYPIDAREPGRRHLSGLSPLLRIVYGRVHARALYWLFAKLGPRRADAVLSLFASPEWSRICKAPILGRLARLLLSPVDHPDADYRRLNLFDGYVNSWAENWSEHELFPVLRDSGIAIKGISPWRTGVWGTKERSFQEH